MHTNKTNLRHGSVGAVVGVRLQVLVADGELRGGAVNVQVVAVEIGGDIWGDPKQRATSGGGRDNYNEL